MKLTGHLADLGLAEILNVVGATRRSGMLRLSLDTLEAVIVFRSGTVVGLKAEGLPSTADELAARAGVASARDPAATEWLAERIETTLAGLLASAHGTFEFALVERPGDVAATAGIVLLEDGLPAARLLSAPAKGTDAHPALAPRPGRLLVKEESLALPGEAEHEAAAAKAADAEAHGGEATSIPGMGDETVMVALDQPPVHRMLVLALGTGDLRRQLARRAREAGWEVREPASLEEAELSLESSVRNGHDVALIAQGTGSTLPGVELIACLRSLDRRAACALVLEANAGAARLSPLRARAAHLGTNVIALVPVLAGAAEADVLAGDLLEHLLARQAGTPIASAPVALGPEASGPDPTWTPAADAPRTVVDLDGIAGACAATRHSSEAALLFLSAAAEHFERGILLVKDGEGLLPVGAIIPHGDRPPASLLEGRHLAVGDDVLSRAATQGVRFVGEAPEDAPNVDALRFLGVERPNRIAALPLLAESGCFAVLYGDDAGDPEAQPDLTRLLTFVAVAGPSLHAAFVASAARAQARATRLAR